jgi:hypothetical protein
VIDRQRALIDRAREKYGRIQPCSSRQDLADSFTEEEGQLHFWFNTEDGNTRVLIEGRLV